MTHPRYRHLLVHADASRACAARLRLARRLADQQGGADITVLYAERHRAPAAGMPLEVEDEADLAIDLPEDAPPASRRDRARALFERVMDERPGVSWAERGDESAEDAVCRLAAAADLVVLGQPPAPGDRGVDLPGRFVEHVLHGCGRPVLLVPDDVDPAWPWARALLAWDGTAPCARTVEGALPLLAAVESVDIFTWGAPPDGARPGADIADDLVARHVRVQVHREERLPPGAGDIGAAVLHAARLARADLVVMGCYRRGAAHDRLLGGPTRTVLAGMRVPVVMMH